jgi:NAD+ kinase
VEVSVCLPFSLDEHSKVDLPSHLKLTDLNQALPRADMLICFGGDGTILHAAKDANPHQLPILGVNMGSVGFMAELEHSELSLLSRLVHGKYELEERMMLDAVVKRDGKTVFCESALNDAVLTKGAVARVLDLEVTGDRVTISAFSGDGVIVCTPTGSTAYSMAAGGPIVEPTAKNIIVTPICAHSLRVKPMVLDRNRTVGIRLEPGSRRSAYLSVDGGRAFKVLSGDRVEVRRSTQVTRLVKLTGRSFYELVHQKLGKG